jgi:type IV pilus biogenesis protein CpaD/CtpE
LAAVLAAAIAAGCASAPPAGASTTPTAVPANQPAAISTASPATTQRVSVASTTATPPVTNGAEAKQADLAKNARTMGYKPKKGKDGNTLWCKTEAPTGTRFETTNCVSEQTMAMQVEEMLQTQDYLRSQQGCNGGGCGAK